MKCLKIKPCDMCQIDREKAREFDRETFGDTLEA
jgi:hypothetical protein